MADVLYEDNHVLVAVKPPNMLSQGDETGDTDLLTLLKEYLRQEYHPAHHSIRSTLILQRLYHKEIPSS